MYILARVFAPARNTDRQKEMVKCIFDILDIILRLSRALRDLFKGQTLYKQTPDQPPKRPTSTICIILCNMVSCTIWYHIEQYGIILYNMVPYCTIWYHIVQYGIILYNMVSYCTIWYHVQYGIILYNMVSYCTIWYHIIQYGIILYYMVSYCQTMK